MKKPHTLHTVMVVVVVVVVGMILTEKEDRKKVQVENGSSNLPHNSRTRELWWEVRKSLLACALFLLPFLKRRSISTTTRITTAAATTTTTTSTTTTVALM